MFEALVRRLGGTNESISRFLIVCMAIGFASLAAAGIAAAWSTARSQQHIDAVNHSYEVERTIARARLLIEQAETPPRGYIISRQLTYLDTYRTAVTGLALVLNRLQRLTADNPRQQVNLVRLRALTDSFQEQRAQTNALVKAERVDEAIRVFNKQVSSHEMRAIRSLATAMAR